MSNVNDFVPFCPTDTGTNLETQANYLTDPDRTIGNQPGIASSQLVNKALRQGTAIASQVAQYISNFANVSVLDTDGVEAQLLSQIQATFQPLAPIVTQYLSGTGTWNATFVFFIASGNATSGATYANNTVTYTVTETISSGVILKATGSGAPTAGGGTLTKTSGTGDSALTFYAFRQALHLNVQMVGGGGGGGGEYASGGGAGGNGGTTTFGTSLLTANGGSGGGSSNVFGGAGGSATIASGPIGFVISGSGGSNGSGTATSSGGDGGVSSLGGRGLGGCSWEPRTAGGAAGVQFWVWRWWGPGRRRFEW